MDFRQRAIELIENNRGYARTGCTLLDLAVGGGQGLGFPFGRILNFVGDKSSGKTFVANEIIANSYYTHKDKLQWNYDDSESGYTFDTQGMYGFDISAKSDFYSSTVEQLDSNLYKFLKKLKESQKGIYVVDSLDGLANADVLEREVERVKGIEKAETDGKIYKDKGSYSMQSQKFLSQEFFKTKAEKLQDKSALLIFISQLRDKIDASMFERKWTRAGGKALDFYAHTVLVLANCHKIKKEGRTIGVVIKALCDKSKTPRPYRECVFTLYFDYGIDDVGSNLDFLFDLRGKDFELTKKAEAIQFDGVEKTMTTVKEWLIENELYDKAKEEKKEETGKSALSLEWVEEWLSKDSELSVKAEAYFGKSYTRDELLQMADDSLEFKREIEIRTIAKWEEIEYNLRTARKAKYAQPEKEKKEKVKDE